MTYVSKGEKIFTMPCGMFTECTPPKIKRSDGRLKRFSSILDDRVWSLSEKQRYRYLYDTMGGSRTCVSVSSCFKYIPLEEIINILLADRDAYIKCLEKKLGISGSKDEIPIDELYKARCFEDEEEQDVLSMKNKIGALSAELEEYKNTRETLRQAMHKLENIDEIINENECLKKRLRCSEEMIKYLEEKKSKLEKELENIRTKSEIQMDLEGVKETLKETIQKEQIAEGEDLALLARERDNLQRRVCELQRELSDARCKQSELELLKKQSESTTVSLEEITRENECYKKKLALMKCLEKQIQELKKQANLLAEKYKRNACRASDQDKQMRKIYGELQTLREERDRLKKKVDDLACYECQYNSLQCKLQKVDVIIAENDMMNCKLASLEKLEVENQYLRCKLEQCQLSELEAAESKEKIIELQNAIADQEEEMKDLLCQIERLTRAYGVNDELDRLKEQLCEKDGKLKLCEEQLAEIPLLEAEIDELRSKLENCCNNISGSRTVKKISTSESIATYGEFTRSKDSNIIETRYEEDVDFEMEPAVYEEIRPEEAVVLEKMDGEKGSMTCEEVQCLLQSSKGIINCVLEDMIEYQREMEELEKCNQEMKNEICFLKAKMGKTDMDDCLQQIAELRRTIEEKELKICCLETQIARGGDIGKVNEHISNLECEIEYLKDLNRKMRGDLEEACCEIQRCAELECLVEEERRARQDLSKQLESRRSTKSQKEEFNLEAKVSSTLSKKEVEDLKNEVEELKKENSLLKEIQTPPDYQREINEKEALENLLSLLQCELDSCLQKKMGDDCEELKSELKRLENQNCQLKSLVNCYKERLDLERCSREASGSSTGSRSSSLQEENIRLRSEITRLRCELVELCKRIQQNEAKICEQENEIEALKACCGNLVRRNDELEKEVDEKDNESQNLKGEVSKLLDQTYKLSSDNDVLKNRLSEAETNHSGVQKEDYEKDLNEKYAVESAMRNLEEEVDGLKMKLEECSKAELEKNNLLKKQADMESEMEKLRKQLLECREKDEKAHLELKSGSPLPPQSPADVEVKPTEPTPETKVLSQAKAKEEKLLEEMVGMREQTVKLQAEANEAKAENKMLKNEIDELKKLLDQCNKEKAHEAAQASLKSSKLQGMSYPVPAEAQGVPQTVIPIKEEQRAAVYERGMPGEVTQATPGAKAAYIENEAPQGLVKFVADAEDFKKQKGEKAKSEGPIKPNQAETQPSKMAESATSKPTAATPAKAAALTPSKAAVLTPSKAAVMTPSKVVIVTPPKAAALTPSKAAVMTPSKAAVLTPSKAAVLTPSKAAVLTPSKAAVLTPSKAAVLTPSKAAVMTPSKAAIMTPSKAAVATSSNLGQMADSGERRVATGQPLGTVGTATAKGKRGELATSDSDESMISFSDIDPDFSKFLCSLNPANHKQNICEIERRYKNKICELQRKNEERVKMLVEQHLKEAKMRDQTYNNNITAMKSGYETDIRKLVERHKASIMRLQGLHEDEVHELNVNYEAEIEAMQAQSENIVNDLTMGAREKFKLLAEQHDREMKELEKKYEQLLEKKENEHVVEMSKLKANMSHNIERAEEYHNKKMSDMTIALEGNIADIQTRHSAELKKLKKNNLKRIDILKHKYEELLMCERKKYEEQLEEMVRRLRQGKALADGICQCRFTATCGLKDPNAPIEFNDVIQKILTEGLESLSFNEVALVHKRTCAATEDIVLKSGVKAQLEPPIKVDSLGKSQLAKANKDEMLNRILELENEIAIKQMETQDAILNMEIAVKAERKRLQELRNVLINEHGNTSDFNLCRPKVERDIKSAIDLQCTPVREQDIMQKIKEMEMDKCKSLIPEKDSVKVLHKRDAHSENRKQKTHTADCKPKHKGTTKKKH